MGTVLSSIGCPIEVPSPPQAHEHGRQEALLTQNFVLGGTFRYIHYSAIIVKLSMYINNLNRKESGTRLSESKKIVRNFKKIHIYFIYVYFSMNFSFHYFGRKLVPHVISPKMQLSLESLYFFLTGIFSPMSQCTTL